MREFNLFNSHSVGALLFLFFPHLPAEGWRERGERRERERGRERGRGGKRERGRGRERR